MNDGMSLIEILLSISVLTLLAVISVPVSVGWYRAYDLNAEVDKMWFVLATARARAQINMQNQPSGVWFGEHAYVLFSGDTYDANNSSEDNFILNGPIRITSTQNPIVFQNISAYSTGGVITLTAGDVSRVISINTEGFIW